MLIINSKDGNYSYVAVLLIGLYRLSANCITKEKVILFVVL